MSDYTLFAAAMAMAALRGSAKTQELRKIQMAEYNERRMNGLATALDEGDGGPGRGGLLPPAAKHPPIDNSAVNTRQVRRQAERQAAKESK